MRLPLVSTIFFLLVGMYGFFLFAEDAFQDPNTSNPTENQTSQKSSQRLSSPGDGTLQSQSTNTSGNQKKVRTFFNSQEKRVDAGVFHVGFAAGGNFFIEPEEYGTIYSSESTGQYFTSFGLQAGIYLDHDYSELTENVPLMIRAIIGYRYILDSIHIFAVDGLVRYMMRFSEHNALGLGGGVSAGIWYVPGSYYAPPYTVNEVAFVPALLLSAGIEFDNFFGDFKTMVKEINSFSTILGFELSFGFRL